MDWSVTGGQRMRGLSIIEVPCRDERLAKQGRNPEVSSFSSSPSSPLRRTRNDRLLPWRRCPDERDFDKAFN